MKILLAVSLVLAMSGCAGCANLLYETANLIRCGPMPMGPSDCEPDKREGE